MTKGVFLLLGGLCALVLASCGGPGGTGTASGDTGPTALDIPSQLVGLAVQQEDVQKELEQVERPYVDSVSVFSFRDEDLLRATLQIGRFNRLARPDDPEFRREITATIGGREPVRLKVGETNVTATTVTEQDVYVWFSGNGMFILSVAADYEFPRTLLRRVVELELSL